MNIVRVLACAVLMALALVLPSSADSVYDRAPLVIDAVRPLQWHGTDYETGESLEELRTYCTAAFINETYMYWLTAAHCIQPKVDLFIAGYPAHPVAVLIAADLAILQTEVRPATPALKLAKKGPTWGDSIQMGGYLYGLGPLYVRGIISHPALNMVDFRGTATAYMLFQMDGCPGNSGSPVVNSKHSVVSVLQIGFDQNCTGLMGGAPYELLVSKVGAFFGARGE